MEQLLPLELLQAQQERLTDEQKINDAIEVQKRAQADQLMTAKAVVDALVLALRRQVLTTNSRFYTVDVLSKPEAFSAEHLAMYRLAREVPIEGWGDTWFQTRIKVQDYDAENTINQTLHEIFEANYEKDKMNVRFASKIIRDDTFISETEFSEVSRPTFVRAQLHADDCPF